jgi:hypothetical protein
MKQKQILLFGALGVGAYLLLSGKLGGTGTDTDTGTGGGRMFTLPNGQTVPESQLPSMGYVKYEGQWYLASDLQPPNVPAGTSPNSQTWMDYVNAALQTGQQLFVLGGELGSSIAQIIKSTAVDWNNSNVTVKVSYGYLSYNGVVNPTTNVTRSYADQQIVISGTGQQTKIKLLKAGVVKKEATIDFYNEKLIGFSAGSVGITGVYIGSAYSNIDTVTSMYGIGAIGNPIVYALALEKAKERLNEQKRYGGIGSTYDYPHPKSLTLCTDGNYSDSHKGACSYRGGAYAIKLRNGQRDYTGKGKYELYAPYRKAYKSAWAKQNRTSKSDRVVTL